MGNPIKAISSAVSNIFNPKTPEVVKPEAKVAIPPAEASALAARKKLAARAQRGREGTIYSQSYQGSNLGGTA